MSSNKTVTHGQIPAAAENHIFLTGCKSGIFAVKLLVLLIVYRIIRLHAHLPVFGISSDDDPACKTGNRIY